jgi:uncharacterized SAM-binding protein YcdF (DUF218 family)
MYNLLSKIAYLFIAPENWIMVLVLMIFLSRTGTVKKRLTLLVLALVFLFGNPFLYRTLVKAWQPKPVTLAAGVSYEAGIVLGGAVSFDRYDQGYFNSASDRFIEACILYKTGRVKKIIISGGSNAEGQPKDADYQYRKMLELGIPAVDIIVENSSRSTFENASFTKKKIDSMHLKPPFVLVTSAMHIPRAKSAFTKAGLAVIPFPCDYHVIDSRPGFLDFIIPNPGTILNWSLLLKEVIGMAGYKLFGRA